MIIGNKETFAIEVIHDTNYTSGVFGCICLWIQGIHLGDIHEEACHLGVTYRAFERVLESINKQTILSLKDMDEAKAFKLIDEKIYAKEKEFEESDLVYYAYDFLTNGGESFDETKSFIIENDNQYKILFHDYTEKKNFYTTVKKQEFLSVIDSFLNWHDSKEQLKS